MGSNVTKVLIMVAVLVALTAVAVGALQTTAATQQTTAATQQTTAAITAVGPSAAVVKQCYSVPCYGNANREVIYERIGDGKRDHIFGFGNNDTLHANTYTNDTDRLYGWGGGTDYIFVNDGDTRDGAHGGPGNDYCYVDAAIEVGNGCEQVVYR